MKAGLLPTIRSSFVLYPSAVNAYILVVLVLLTMPAKSVQAGSEKILFDERINLRRVVPEKEDGFGYVLQYYVSAPIEAFWRFKTDFNSEILLTSDELVGHRLVEWDGNNVTTENRYATAPGLRFLWQTTVIPNQHRLEFKLLNPEDCRHSYHFGSIQLSPAGNYTKVTQTAIFDFRGASLWVKYPWYGGMKHTLTKVAKWEQKMAEKYKRRYLAAVGDWIKE